MNNEQGLGTSEALLHSGCPLVATRVMPYAATRHLAGSLKPLTPEAHTAFTRNQ